MVRQRAASGVSECGQLSGQTNKLTNQCVKAYDAIRQKVYDCTSISTFPFSFSLLRFLDYEHFSSSSFARLFRFVSIYFISFDPLVLLGNQFNLFLYFSKQILSPEFPPTGSAVMVRAMS